MVPFLQYSMSLDDIVHCRGIHKSPVGFTSDPLIPLTKGQQCGESVFTLRYSLCIIIDYDVGFITIIIILSLLLSLLLLLYDTRHSNFTNMYHFADIYHGITRYIWLPILQGRIWHTFAISKLQNQVVSQHLDLQKMTRCLHWEHVLCMWGRYVRVEPMTSWWRHQMHTFSALLALCAGNSPVTGEFPSQRPVTRSFDVFFDLCLNKRLSKPSRRRWFETPSCPLCRHCNADDGLQWIPQPNVGCDKWLIWVGSPAL